MVLIRYPGCFFVIVGRIKNLNGQWSPTIGCDEAEKVRGCDG